MATIEELRERVAANHRDVLAANTLLNEAEAELLRALLRPVFEQNPGLEEIHTETYPEYDDEGGYYTCLTVHGEWNPDAIGSSNTDTAEDDLHEILYSVSLDGVHQLADDAGTISRKAVLS
jgi:hypothetical protein